MDIKLFTEILRDRHFTDYKKMRYKYGEAFDDFLADYGELYYRAVPLCDFNGDNIVFVQNEAVAQNAVKLLLQPQDKSYGRAAAEEEIISTSAIERVELNRDSVRRILSGMAPVSEQENRIMGMKRGLEFIANTGNAITPENFYKLYMTAVGEYLPQEDRLPSGSFYRDDKVYIVSDRIEHFGLDAKKLPEYMSAFFDFANCDDGINDLAKAAVLHFYIAFIHPYFDGNGRMARLVHLWFLVQRGYRSALFIPFSSRIEKSRSAYYAAFTAVEENKKYSGRVDVTPFIDYFTDEVYNKIGDGGASVDTLTAFDGFVKSGRATEKEVQLWRFVLSSYGTGEFSTKQLEKDFGNAAYATVRGFVLKFEEAGLLSSVKYGVRTKYRIPERLGRQADGS